MGESIPKANKRIDEEVVCLDALAYHLKEKCGCNSVKVMREKDDPPDFWINIDKKCYAVEVMSIVKEQDYRATLNNLANEVCRDAKNQGIINGTYVLDITRHPNIPRRNSSEWKDLISKALSFIKRTFSDEPGEAQILLKNNNGIVEIEKWKATGSSIGIIITDAKFEGEVIQEMRCLLQKAVTTKRVKLEKKKVPQKCPQIILALYDAYGYGTKDEIMQILQQIQGYKWFHSVFWAASFTNRPNEIDSLNPGRNGSFLYSKSKRWFEV